MEYAIQLARVEGKQRVEGKHWMSQKIKINVVKMFNIYFHFVLKQIGIRDASQPFCFLLILYIYT